MGDPDLWIPTPELEALLNEGLVGISLWDLPLRTRSKFVKAAVCRALGYPVPKSFKKTRPRFPGQDFDTYNQKSNNLQIWNEDISPTRRYAIIRVSPTGDIKKVRVVTGEILAVLDTTGRLTQKYQARFIIGDNPAELVVSEDTENIRPLITTLGCSSIFKCTPIDDPTPESLLPIAVIFERLKSLVGYQFADTGYDQERNRGTQLHRLICAELGYRDYRDDGRFPDIRNQLIEVKLQTSPTIDLGLILPNSQKPLDMTMIEGHQIRPCDVRYALFYAATDGIAVTLTHFILTTGEAFFAQFPQFQGKVLNKKLQIPLPKNFFD